MLRSAQTGPVLAKVYVSKSVCAAVKQNRIAKNIVKNVDRKRYGLREFDEALEGLVIGQRV
jgi:hypothetical protein